MRAAGLATLLGVAIASAIATLGVLGPLALGLGGLGLLGAAAWVAGWDSRDRSERWPFGPAGRR